MIGPTGEPVVWTVLSVVALAGVVLVLRWVGVPFRTYWDRLQSRFIYGIPWGTVVVVIGLFAVYLFVQRGFWHWHRPVVVAFTAVSMLDPTGWVFAGFSHASPSHLRGNVTTVIVFGPIVEWMWGHYSEMDRGWRDRPAIRAFVLFPLGIAAIGVMAALFSWGPVIGFSVAVYALIGIVLVRYPVIAVLALVVRQAVRLGWRTVTDPVQVSRASVQVVEPSWYGSAVQGHLVGLLLGVLVGLWLLDQSDATRPSAPRLFAASALIGGYLSLWAIWWVLGPDQFVLFRAAGVIVVLVVALVITLAVIREPFDRPAVNRLAIGLIIVGVVGMGIVGIGLNFATADPPEMEPTHHAGDYSIYYGENVPDGMVNIVDVEAFGLTTDARTSGVIVVSEDRGVWRQTVSATELETHGIQQFTVGGLGWSEEVYAVRRGWVVAGSGPVYDVWLGDGEEFDPAFTSDDRPARPVVANHTFSMSAADGEFFVNVYRDDAVVTVPVPSIGEAVAAHDVEITRLEHEIVVVTEDTAVPIASREQYR